MMKQKVTVSWSGGKDSAFALYKILVSGEYDVAGLHTVIDEKSKRVGLHGVREEMIRLQAEAIGLPIEFILLPAAEDHDQYESVMKTYYRLCKQGGVDGVVFGDIFLEDLKHYREKLLRDSALVPIFPLWKIDSLVVVNDFINSGFKTLVCSANASIFTEDQVGKTIDDAFVARLPLGVDACGENGEFHTFVYDGPIFKNAIAYKLADVVKKSYHYSKINDDGKKQDIESSFWFQDFMSRIVS